MSAILERLKIAAQEAQRVHKEHGLLVVLTIVTDGVLVNAKDYRFDLLRSHATTATWHEIETGLNNVLIGHISRAVAELTSR